MGGSGGRVPPAGADADAETNCSTEEEPLDLVCFSLIVDDIVYWDGRTSMANVGGGGPQALWGYAAAARALSSDAARRPPPPPRIALAAGVGESDLPASVRDWLSGPCLGADLSGLFPCPGLPTPRAWQLLEADGGRTQVWRRCEAGEALFAQLRPPFASLPDRLRLKARSYHVGVHAAHPPRSLLASLRRAVDARRAAEEEREGAGGRGHGRGLLSAETYTRCDAPLGIGELRALLAPLDVFSPNEEEAASMLGAVLPRQEDDGDGGEEDDQERAAASARRAERLLLDPLLDAAPAHGLTVTLRRGRRGALAKSSSPFENGVGVGGGGVVGVGGGGGGGGRSPAPCVRVPAVPGLAAIDPTGCGNAFCGAFIAAAHAGRDLREAVAWGCAAGGTMAEHEGVPRGAAAAALAALAPVVGARARGLLSSVRAGACGSGGALRDDRSPSSGRGRRIGAVREAGWPPLRVERPGAAGRASASASALARPRAI